MAEKDKKHNAPAKIVFDKTFNRRSFIKGSAALTAAAGITVASPGKTVVKALATGSGSKKEKAEEKVFVGACRGNCAGACAMNVHVRDGKVVKTSSLKLPEGPGLPSKDFERICSRGLAHVQRIYGAERLKYPMRRVGERGAGQWEQLTWDEAIDYICSKWKTYQKEYGEASIGFSEGYGSSSPDTKYYQRLRNLMGAANINNGYDLALLGVGGNTVGFGQFVFGNDIRLMAKAKYIFVWGANPTEAGHVNWVFLQRALDAGAKMIVIDPNYTIAASKADQYVPIRPGSDGAMMLAMINVAEQEGLVDEKCLKEQTVAPFLVKDDGTYLRLSDLNQAAAGSSDDAIVVRSETGEIGLPTEILNPVIRGSYEIEGIRVTTAYDLLIERAAEWTLERASKVCDVPEETIYELLKMYAEGPTISYTSYGPDHFGNGQTFYYSLFALMMTTGQIGKEGAGIGGFACNTMILDYGNNMGILNPPQTKPAPVFFAPKLFEALDNGKYGNVDINLKSLFVYIHNPIGNQTDRKSWLKLFDKLDLVVVADTVMNDTTRYADLVLPVPHFFEVETYFGSYNGYLCMNEKAIEPLGESKGDFEIATLLGQGMGLGEFFTMTREDYHTEMFNNPFAQMVGVTWEKMKKEKMIPRMDFDAPKYVHGVSSPYSTRTGRAQFYQENILPNTDYGQTFDQQWEALPYWEPPLEAWPENPLYEKYPLIFMSERGKFKTHTQFTYCQWFLEILPEPTILINDRDAKARGIKHGDYIKVYNDRGYVVAKAEINPANRPGVLLMDHGWSDDQFHDGHYSDLTSRETSRSIINNAFFDCLVEVQKV